MDDEQFTKLFKYMQERFDQVDQRFGKVDADIDNVRNLLDDDLKRRDVDNQERLIIGHQLSRHEEWIERAASRLKIKYDDGG